MIDPDDIEEDIGDDAEPTEASPDTSVKVQAPDAGEIEWAGGLVKKAPGPVSK